MSIGYVEIAKIKPAPYNPREITETQFNKLKDSLRRVGFIIPIIINKQNNVIIAGHQRSKAAAAIGMKTVPCFYINDISLGDEIKFNQMHNGTDIYSHLPLKYYGEQLESGEFYTVASKLFEKNLSKKNLKQVNEMCKLILKYGNVFCTVLCGDQAILHTEYIKACQLLNIDCNVFVLDESKKPDACEFLKQDYGKYSYKSIERHTYVQGLAQLNRLSQRENKRKLHSVLYENMVIPFVTKHKQCSIFDFGCGKGAYVKKLAAQGYDISGLEFFNHNSQAIDVAMGNKMIDAFLERIKQLKSFDVVVCDSVINSVDSMDTEFSVMASCNLLTHDKLFISGRSKEFCLKTMDCGKSNGLFETKHNMIYYLDDNDFSANYRKGHWFFQHFHTETGATQMVEKYGFEIEKITNLKGSSWQIEARKIKQLSKEEYRRAIEIEFNLPLPFGKTYNRHKDVLQVFEQLGIV